MRSVRWIAGAMIALGTTLAPDMARAQPAPAPPDSVPAARAVIDEEFDLDVDDQRIRLGRLEAVTEVGIGGPESGFAVRIGAVVLAEQVDLRLRGVRGHVRFHASLERLRRTIRAHRPTTTPTR
jgi:hypothetical protein